MRVYEHVWHMRVYMHVCAERAKGPGARELIH